MHSVILHIHVDVKGGIVVAKGKMPFTAIVGLTR